MKKIVLFCLFLAATLAAKTIFASERFQQSFRDTWTGEIIKVSPEISYDIYETAQKALKDPGAPAWTKDSVYSMQWNPLKPFTMIKGHVRSGIIYNKNASILEPTKMDFPKDKQKSIFILSPFLLIICSLFYYFRREIVWMFISMIFWAVALDIAFDVFKNSTFFAMSAISSIIRLVLIAVTKPKSLIAKINFTTFLLIMACEITFLIFGI
jgi:hypothetical protein